jgi:hypothetical protein
MHNQLIKRYGPMAALGAAVCLGIVCLLTDPAYTSLQDFVEYWAAGRASLDGRNPYDRETLYTIERSVSPDLTDAIMMWNPPWTLSITLPFSLLPARSAFAIWVLAQASILLGSAAWLWGYFGGSRQSRWIGCIVAAAFIPTFFVLRMGQITPVVLLGVVGHLAALEKNRDFLAGAMLGLTAIKPHLVFLFVAAALVHACWTQRWRVPLATAAMIACLSLPPWLVAPEVFHHYIQAMADKPPDMLSPTLGALLRLVFGIDQLWLQNVPPVLGLIWLAWFLSRNNCAWDWRVAAGHLLFASVLLTNYGAWPFDLVILLVPVIQASVWAMKATREVRLFAATFLTGFNTLALLLMNVHWAHQYWHVWMTPALLYGYFTVRRESARETRPAQELAHA